VNRILAFSAVCMQITLSLLAAQAEEDLSGWTIYITNDNCPDYTWGYSEEQTRQAFADIVRGHLDEMKRTDNEKPENRDRYNMAVTQEALCFVERYPERKVELIRRVQEGRAFVSPYLCNSLWALQSVECAIRTFYPARGLEREWGISIDVAEHIEQPSLPWGVASILAGCGVRWLSVPFYKYDSTFDGLTNPPLFVFEGPDGSQTHVIMDTWASTRASYMQGARLLRDTRTITSEWVTHYQALGETYPIRAILASGTHGDISPRSGHQARRFAEAIINYNNSPGEHPKLVNAILPQFCEVVDKAQAERAFLPILRGSFGHSWDVWPVCLAKYVADMRVGERAFLAAEALLALARLNQPTLHEATRADRERAEWCWAMLADHAWNGTNDQNKRDNADLRKKWSGELNRLSEKLLTQAWAAIGLDRNDSDLTIFNNLSFPRSDLVRIELSADERVTPVTTQTLDSQIVEENGKRFLYFVSPEVQGFGFNAIRLRPADKHSPETEKLGATPTMLESPYYRLQVDAETGGVGSLIHKASGAELLAGRESRTVCQTVYFDGQEHTLNDVGSEVVAQGPVLARLKVTGTAAAIHVSNLVTVYANLDRVDFDLRIKKPVTTNRERLCHVFPVLQQGAVLRIETTGAVIRPRPQPEGDLLPGADTRRFAVQAFMDASLAQGPGVTIATLDAFVLRMDLDPITFEALGNDQNYREVIQDQHGVTDFRFRYALRGHSGGYDGPSAFAWSRRVATPLLVARGSIPSAQAVGQVISLDPARAIATCLKPADEDASRGCILRFWETAGRSGPTTIGVRGFQRAIRTDLLERDLEELRVVDDKVTVNLRGHGLGAVRLLPSCVARQ